MGRHQQLVAVQGLAGLQGLHLARQQVVGAHGSVDDEGRAAHVAGRKLGLQIRLGEVAHRRHAQAALPLFGQGEDASTQPRHGTRKREGQQVGPDGRVVEKQNVHFF